MRAIRFFPLLGLSIFTIAMYGQEPAIPSTTANAALTNSAVVKMVEAKLGDDLIVAKIKIISLRLRYKCRCHSETQRCRREQCGDPSNGRGQRGRQVGNERGSGQRSAVRS